MRTRCKSCGEVRAKNTTRQFEHLQTCTEFLNSTEGQEAHANGILQMPPDGAASRPKPDIFRGSAPNPNLGFTRPQARPRASGGRPAITPMRPGATPSAKSPSLVNHLLAKNRTAVDAATQVQFLSHAGCGTLSHLALGQWLTQQGHMSRSLITFIGSVIGKIRLPDVMDHQKDTNWRTLDLLLSCLNNAKRELDFLRSTQAKYNIEADREGPKYATKGIVDLFANASNPSASILEAMVVLWSVEWVSCYTVRIIQLKSFTDDQSCTMPHGATPSLSSNLRLRLQHHIRSLPTCHNRQNITSPRLNLAQGSQTQSGT